VYSLDFKIVPSFPDYAISRAGLIIRVTSRTRAKFGCVIKPFIGCEGYTRIILSGKHASVHRLVAETYLGPCPDGCVVNHKDGNKLNNSVSNLEYVTQKRNIQHGLETGLSPSFGETHGMAKLTEKEVLEIRAAYGDCHLCSKLAGKYGVCRSMIYKIRAGRNWKHVA